MSPSPRIQLLFREKRALQCLSAQRKQETANFLCYTWLSLQWLIGDRDGHCGGVCTRTQVKPVCGSDGRSYESTCELQRARCKDKTLTLAHRGRCRGQDPAANSSKQEVTTTTSRVFFHLSGRNWGKLDQLPAAPAPTSASEARDPEVKGKTWDGPDGGTTS